MSHNKVIANAKWIIVCKVAQSLLQLFIGMLCARYLGPSNYGLINYAASVVAFAVPIMQLGLQSTLIEEFIERPGQEGRVMGTAITLEIISSVACIAGVGSFVILFNGSQPQTLIVCMLYSLSLFFRAFELLSCWFQYKLKSKYPSVVMLCAYVLVSAYRLVLLMKGMSVYWFSVVASLDAAIIGVALLVIYRKMSGQRLSFSFELSRELLDRSKYYIISAMMVTVFQNTDHVMLKNMSGDSENGYYTAAITCAVVFQFVYQAIVESMRPVILLAKKNDARRYERLIVSLYNIVIYMGLAQAAVFTLVSPLIVFVLYGTEYSASAAVLRVLVWYIAFSYMGTVRNVWILAEGKQRLLWKINLFGACVNVLLNLVFIPWYGATGAAAASLCTQIMANFVLGFVVKDLRGNNRLLLKGLDPRELRHTVGVVWQSLVKNKKQS